MWAVYHPCSYRQVKNALLWIFTCVVLWTDPSYAGTRTRDSSSDQRQIELPLSQWLQEGRHKDFKWNVRLIGPLLTFQQRNLVLITASIPMRPLQKQHLARDFHFLVKVADQDQWLDGETYVHYQIDGDLKKSELRFSAGLHLEPGTFKIAVIAYESVEGQRNVWITDVTVNPPHHDMIPIFESDVPKVEFLPVPTEGVLPLGEGHSSVSVQNERPVAFDLMLDLTPYAHAVGLYPGRRFRPPPTAYTKNVQSRLLESASVLSGINFQHGCTRVVVLDALRRKTLLSAEPATDADWQKLWDEIVGTELNVVSTGELAGRTDAARYLRDQLERLISQAPLCNASVHPVHVVAILSPGAHFPESSSPPAPLSRCDCKLFYLRQRENLTDLFEDLPPMLRPLSPERMDFSDPKQFRHQLAHLVQAIQHLAAD